jgi:hypothetical protein
MRYIIVVAAKVHLFCGTEIWIQGFALARQVLYHLIYSSCTRCISESWHLIQGHGLPGQQSANHWTQKKFLLSAEMLVNNLCTNWKQLRLFLPNLLPPLCSQSYTCIIVWKLFLLTSPTLHLSPFYFSWTYLQLNSCNSNPISAFKWHH